MRTKIWGVILFMALGFLVGCGNTDDDDSSQNDAINGVWHLKNISGGLLGVDIDYNKGEVKWTFNEGNKTLVIENNIMTTGPEDIHVGLDSGTYTYKVELEGDTKILFINEAQSGRLSIISGILKIDDNIAADGFLSEFVR